MSTYGTGWGEYTQTNRTIPPLTSIQLGRPDCRTLTFGSRRWGNYNVGIMDADGGNQRDLTQK